MAEARYRLGFKPKRNGRYVKRTRDPDQETADGLPERASSDEPLPPLESGETRFIDEED